LDPIIRWAGSKRKLIPKLLNHVPTTYSRYIEPFAGSACLFFALSPLHATLNDLNPELINFYKTITKAPQGVYNLATTYPPTREQYIYLRSLSPDKLPQRERAARFYFLNRFCFNALYRTNKNGCFNVPMGSKTGSFPKLEVFVQAVKRLRSVLLLNSDFEDAIGDVKKGDLVYLDPPYSDPKKRFRNEYGPGSFSSLDIPRMVAALNYINNKKATFILSYSFDKLLLRKLSSYKIYHVTVLRGISGHVNYRKRVKEIIVTNRRCQ
jgi:DNA adenine methylase